jgi:FAD/FMN-containing dehydrogenase
VLLPGTPGYESARRPAVAQFFDTQPAAIVRCGSSGDVVAAIGYARQRGLPVVVRSGGHCFAGRSSTDGVVIDVSPMDAVSVSGGTATIGAGTRLGSLGEALQAYGLALPTGCGRTVGIAGLTLGGGLGVLGRRYGLTCDQLLAARVVLADGRVVDCDEVQHPDLFWALRGAGGGHFGVVTSLVFRAAPAPEMTIFRLTWPLESAASLVRAWVERAPVATVELSANLQLSVPAGVAAPPTASLVGAMCGGRSATAVQLHELTGGVGAEPISTAWRQLPYAEAKRALDEVPDNASEGTELIYRKSEFFSTDLPGNAVSSLLATLTSNRRGGQAREVNFLPMGGAYNQVSVTATAFAHRDQRFLVEHLATVDLQAPAAEQAAAKSWVFASWAAVHPWASGRVYPNFPDLGLPDWADAYWGQNLQRLRGVKRRYDPDDVFYAAQTL